MSKLREAAKGMPCMVRIPGVCNGNPETTILGHYRLSGLNGIGMKPPDICGAWVCSACHDCVDNRVRSDDWEYTEVRFMHAEGVLRTINELIKRGKLTNENRGKV